MSIFGALALIILSIPAYATTYTVRIIDQINSLSVVPGIVKLSLANKNDFVYFYINSPGGQVYAGNKLIEAINDSEATVIVNVDDYAASMAALITINADKIYLKSTAVLLFHVISAYNENTKTWVKCTITEMDRACEGAMTEFYIISKGIKGFVTEEEYQQILNGKDLILNAQTLAERNKKIEIYN